MPAFFPDMSNTLFVTFVTFSFLLFSVCEKTRALPGLDKNELAVVSIPSGKSQEEGSVECEKSWEMDCKHGGKGEIDESVLEAEDYIYTNSNP